MDRYRLFICLIWTSLILSGCVTAESLKKLPDNQLKYEWYDSSGNTADLYRQEIINRHPEWPEEIKQLILKRKVRIGMTKEQARASWGEPYKVNKTITRYGVHEQWVYGIYGYAFLYFENDILTSIQN